MCSAPRPVSVRGKAPVPTFGQIRASSRLEESLSGFLRFLPGLLGPALCFRDASGVNRV